MSLGVWKILVIIQKEKIKKLEKILVNYSDILSEFNIQDQIIKTFIFEKPLTSIEIEGENKDRVAQLIKDLENFFFSGQVYFEPESQELGFSGLILISRFKNLFDVAINYANKHNGLLDEFADISGILFGYSCQEVADYCLKERLKK